MSRALVRESHRPYRPGMPRQPKNFSIAWVSIEPLSPTGYLPTGPDTAVPTRFIASFALEQPQASVTIEVFVGADLRPVVVDLAIRANVKEPITTSVLRRVLVDQLLSRALAEAAVPREPTDQPRHRRKVDQEAELAARIYLEAVATGSRAPTMAVAHTMNRSRAQASRYVRRARELGLLPAPDPQQEG
ncbi:hypothetical protein FFT09_09215 [Saccharomonospora piscinae]|nr:hypothetical protein FFT09_09215 [Saccharomonospora piscinae]